MEEIINMLVPFFEDCYRKIGVREYARLMGVSPPKASKLLHEFHKAKLLNREVERRFIFFSANPSRDFVDYSRIYWRKKLLPLCKELEQQLVNPTIMLFGSLAKGEASSKSDVDIVVISQKKVDVKFKAKRTLSLQWFKSLKDIQNEHLLNNMLNGYILAGRLRWE